MFALLFALALVSAPDTPAVINDTMIPVVETAAPAEATLNPDEPAKATAADSAPEPTIVAEAKPEELPFPVGAPTDDYGLVAWCYGALGGYLELHDRVLPEVSRIENAYRRPGTTLADDMSTYADMQKISRSNMKLFAAAMEAAERASLQPINIRGATAVKKGRASWAGADALPVRAVAQQWMGWALSVRCTPTASTLETRAKLMGTAFKVNEVEAETSAEATPVEAVATTTPRSDVVPAPGNALPVQ